MSELLLMYRKDGANDILNCHQSCWGTWYWRRSWIFVRFFIKTPPWRNCSAELSEDKKSNTVWWRKLFARQINKEISKCHLQNVNDTFVLEHNKSKYFFSASRERARCEKSSQLPKRRTQIKQIEILNFFLAVDGVNDCFCVDRLFGQLARRWCQERNNGRAVSRRKIRKYEIC